MSASTMRSTTALSLVRSGLSMQFAGTLWGLMVQNTPYPRLALTAHIQFMAEGAMVLLVGILLQQTSLLELGAVQSRIVRWGFSSAWIPVLAECVNAFWGTKEILPIAALSAGAPGAAAWQEQIMTAAHILPSVGLIVGFGVLLSGAFAERKETKLKG